MTQSSSRQSNSCLKISLLPLPSSPNTCTWEISRELLNRSDFSCFSLELSIFVWKYLNESNLQFAWRKIVFEFAATRRGAFSTNSGKFKINKALRNFGALYNSANFENQHTHLNIICWSPKSLQPLPWRENYLPIGAILNRSSNTKYKNSNSVFVVTWRSQSHILGFISMECTSILIIILLQYIVGEPALFTGILPNQYKNRLP